MDSLAQPSIAVAPESPRAVDALLGGALVVLAFVLYRGSAPAVVNLDGLGYLKLLPHNFAAGHLLYMPLLRAATAAFHGQGLEAGHWLSATAGALSVGLAFLCARCLVGRSAAVLAAAGLAVSYGAWVQGADVEVYAVALAALLALFAVALAYRASPGAGVALAIGVALGVAVLTHLTHVLATPFVVVWIARHARGRRAALAHAALACTVGGALSIAAYAWAALHVRGVGVGGALRWIATARHGFSYSGGPLDRLADAVYGLARSLVWSPYLYESDAQRLLGQFLLGLGATALLVGVIVARRGALPPLPRTPLAVWIGAYAAMALGFFGADHERWLFVLPPLWLLASAAISTLARPSLVAAAAVALLAAANAATAIGPATRERWDRTRAEDAAAVMSDGDLVIFPGHSWDEYVGFYPRRDLEPLPLAYYAGVLGPGGCLARLDREVAAARRRHARIWALRLDDADGTPGFYELASLGLSRSSLGAVLARLHPTPVATVEPKVTVWRLDAGE
jgi:hypothetical protein